MIKNISLVVIAFLLSVPSFAKNRTERELQVIASQYLGLPSDGKTSRASSINLKKYQISEQVALYGSQGHGFVVLSQDDDFTPVLGYSDTDFKENAMPCGFLWWLHQVDNALQLRKAHAETYQPIYSSTRAAATNFIKTAWNQQAPYNNLCPKVDGKLAPTGCVATAMAQIMYYYQYPSSSKGMGAYSVIDSNGKSTPYTCQINSTYAWDKMKLRYITPVDKDNAIATLMRDAGAASKMQYTSLASGTSDFYAAMGFYNNFKYDSLAIKRYPRDFYTDKEWMQMVATEMEAKRPILYCGQDPVDGGHAFVLDGLNEDGLVHVNWGWSGSGNGWYDINVLKPTSYSGSGLDEGEGFHDNQSMILGFKCQETPDDTEENNSLWLTDSLGFFVDDNKLSLRIADLANYSCRYFAGTVDVVLEDASNPSDRQTSNIVDTNDSEDEGAIAPGYGYNFTDDDDKPGELDLSEIFPMIKAGSYKLYVGSKSTAESSYQIVRGEGGPIVYNLTVSSDGKLSVDKENQTTGIHNVWSASSNLPSRFYDLNGKELPSANSITHGVLIMKQGKDVKKILRK